ncbi:hypothetical protein LCGC14_0258880 [marine sediment metagenome]|uniref:Uncharacterized protein n=1 Tax=marine sediment metagenome TaxID=412755 RepID=A0A0F9X782_9ZZZZ
MTAQINHVRLKPRKPAAGQVKRQYGAPWGFNYKAGVWYVEPDDLADERVAYLRTIHMNSCDPFSPRAFNLCTREEAEQIKLYEESGELEQVLKASRPAAPPAPTAEGAAAPSEDLNLPAPKSELAAAAQAAATASAEALEKKSAPPPAEQLTQDATADPPSAPKKTGAKSNKSKAGRPRARRRNPGR